MCQNSEIIARVKNGELSFCKDCNTYALTFNNIFFQFTKDQLYKFKYYVSQIDVYYWLGFKDYYVQKRKIPIPTSHQNLILIFDLNEIKALRILLGIDNKYKSDLIDFTEIDYPMLLN